MRRRNKTLLLVAMLSSLMASSADGHHNSGAAFNLQDQITIKGVVSRYEWKNPHLYFYVDETTGTGEVRRWRIEAGPLAFMRRLGWDRDSLVSGDRVTLTANPSRRKGVPSAFLRGIETESGTALTAFASRAGGEILTNNAPGEVAADEGFAGVWVTVGNSELLGQFDNPDVLPLAPRGRQSLQDFDESTMHPGLECIPFVAPFTMIIPDTKLIEMTADGLRIRGEWDDAERTIYFESASMPDNDEFLQGRSTGRQDGGKLLVATDRFAPHRTGIAFGVESGARKTLSEEFDLFADQRSLTYRFEMRDPDFLDTPVTGEVRWLRRPDLVFESLPCDRANARQFLQD